VDRSHGRSNAVIRLVRRLRVDVFRHEFSGLAEDKDLASVVWETALEALQAVAAESSRASANFHGKGAYRMIGDAGQWSARASRSLNGASARSFSLNAFSTNSAAPNHERPQHARAH
jgi:hypothetical protein